MGRLSWIAVVVVWLGAGCDKSNEPSTATAPATRAPSGEEAAAGEASGETPREAERPAAPAARFVKREVARLDEPWAMTFLPDGRLVVTEKRGRIKLVTREGEVSDIEGAPEVAYGGQGGLGDVILHPRYADNGVVYLSWAEGGAGNVRGAAVGRGRLVLAEDGSGGRIEGLRVIWRQAPKVTGEGHYGHRLAFAPSGHLFITSGERQKMRPAQDMATNLGKIVRLNEDGSVPDDNPFAERGGVTAQIWTLGHRNPLGIAFDAEGRLWAHEMGPRGGDELNLVERGKNYGWPEVSEGMHYDGREIPDHGTAPELEAPVVSWNPVISPAGFIIYDGDAFAAWRGDGLIGGLSSQALIRVTFEGERAREAERWEMGARIREVEQGPDGAIWVIEDGPRARLLRLVPEG